jgi:hypothetical protein
MSIDREREVFHRTADLMGLADTHRWTIIKMIRTQSVAEHSFGVAIIAWALAENLGLRDDQKLMLDIFKWALIHDAPESFIGDIDGRFKRDYPRVRTEIALAEGKALPWWLDEGDIEARARLIVKVADNIEATVYVKTWGVGARAEDIHTELRMRVLEDSIGRLSEVIPMTRYDVTRIVHEILNSLEGEADTYQLRRPQSK